MWYGKGPGVDRCGDVFKHANFAGTSKHGGVLVLAGDDHARQVVDAAAPVRPPVLGGDDAGALSVVGAGDSRPRPARLGDVRYSGCWVGFKCVADTVESSASVDVDPERTSGSSSPTISRCRPTALSIRWPDPFLATEARMHDYKIYAALPTAASTS